MILGLKRIKSQRTQDRFYIGECRNCCTKTTFNKEGYCSECGSLFGPTISMEEYDSMFLINYWKQELSFEPEIPEGIITELTNKGEKPKPYKPRRQTQKNNHFKKQNFMKKGFKSIGNAIINGTCKTLGGAHLVVQTTADVIAVTEAIIKHKAYNEDKVETVMKRKVRTAEIQIEVGEKIIEAQTKLEENIDKIQTKTKEKLSSIFKPHQVEKA